MNQISFAQTGFELQTKRTRKQTFLKEMDAVVPWDALVSLIAPFAPKGATGRPPFPIEVMLRIHFLQQWFGLGDEAMEESLHEVFMYRIFAKLDAGSSRLPDESTILRFRHLLEENKLADVLFASITTILKDRGLMLKAGTAVDATLIAAPSSTKNEDGERDPEMRQTKKGSNYHFGMKAHIGVDADSGLVHTVEGTAANVHDVTKAADLLHGEETTVYGDAGYQGVAKREEIQEQHPDVEWHTSMRPGKRRALNKNTALGGVLERIEKLKASVRAKVEHPFRVIKRQFGYTKVRYRGLFKNTQQLVTLFMLSNLWMARRALMLIPSTQQGIRG